MGLRCEQDMAMTPEKDKKILEAQCKDAATRADDAEVTALKGGRKAMIKMETRIRELESELDAETRRGPSPPPWACEQGRLPRLQLLRSRPQRDMDRVRRVLSYMSLYSLIHH